MTSSTGGVWPLIYYTVPVWLLAVAMYALFARFLLGVFIGPDNDSGAMRWLCRLTDPLLWWVRYLTPRAVPDIMIPVIGGMAFGLLRFIYELVLHAAGWAPTG